MELIANRDNRLLFFALSAMPARATMTLAMTPATNPPARDRFGFWAVAFAFMAALGFTTVPAPLWSLFQQRDHFSSLTVTLVFAAYAVGVALSLFLAGHLSDWHGRRRLVVAALILNLVSGALFLGWPSLPGLIVARVLSGLGIGAMTATATAWLAELHARQHPDSDNRRAEVISTAANLGGLGLGALISGALAQWVGAALVVPFAFFIAAMMVALVLVFAAPETRPPANPRPHYRPQRVSVPPQSRARYFAAAGSAVITFAALGLLTSLAPSFVAGTLHHTSRALAGAVSFAVFGAAVVTQSLTASRTAREQLAAAIPTLLLGLALLTLAVWLPVPSLGMFITGVIVIGIGAGLMFKGALATVSALASDENRAEALAGLFLAAYLGLAGPVIGLGVLMQYLSPRLSLLLFAAVLALGILAAAPALLGRDRTERRPRLQPSPVTE
jgi:MFS family permease